VHRSLRVAAVVGTLLVAINYSDRALAGALGPGDWAKMLLTYCVPYGVAMYAAVQALRSPR
jgi:drug/metabolite transporter (DMT)-like permease